MELEVSKNYILLPALPIVSGIATLKLAKHAPVCWRSSDQIISLPHAPRAFQNAIFYTDMPSQCFDTINQGIGQWFQCNACGDFIIGNPCVFDTRYWYIYDERYK